MVIEEPHESVALLGVCAGFEDGAWRSSQLSYDLVQWALDWILTPSELQGLGRANAVDMLGKALSRIYSTTDYENRGEIGELLLHIILRRFMLSEKLISRLYFKDAANDTVKGFDAVHIVENSDDELEFQLWLGESKFYVDSSDAMYAVMSGLKEHLEADYLRSEFAAIVDKIPQDWKHEQAVKKLLNRTISLDSVFKRVVIPVFITFDSEVTQSHNAWTAEYIDAVRQELSLKWESFLGRMGRIELPRTIRVHLILLPMATKRDLLARFDERLKAWQAVTKP
ncbi:hypothetical protein QQ25_18630 [Mycolicibacterium setense]|nr:hypothetical protein QQ25_18630 [Mycolicibacterium setense]